MYINIFASLQTTIYSKDQTNKKDRYLLMFTNIDSGTRASIHFMDIYI